MPTLIAQTIRTERLTLLPLSVEYADEMAAVLSDPELHVFTGGSPATTHDVRARYERLVVGSPDPEVSWCNWVIRSGESGALTGTVQATITSGDAGQLAEIAWVVGTAWQGRGIASEAARALVEWLLAHDARTVIAHIHPDHRASAAVAAAAGLAPTDRWQDGEVRWQLRVPPTG